MTADHVMLDLETWGRFPGCALRSIGAVRFDPEADSYADGFSANILISSCLNAGLKIEEGTEAWWSKQSPEAIMALLKDQIYLVKALENFTFFFKANNAKYLWSHGACFDVPILAAAYHAIGQEPPWNYYYVRDTRTLYDIVSFNPYTTQSRSPGTIAHKAFDDAINQARSVQKAWRFRPLPFSPAPAPAPVPEAAGEPKAPDGLTPAAPA